ncbi:hypothetical protein D3C76_127880 [compost metagenome]
MHPDKRFIRIYAVALIAFALVALLNLWVVYERQKLNQRYQQSIEQFETIVQDYQELEDVLRNHVQELMAE